MITVTARANTETGNVVLEVKENNTVIEWQQSTHYQAPVALRYNGEDYVAFTEYYLGMFEPYKAYKLTQIQD